MTSLGLTSKCYNNKLPIVCNLQMADQPIGPIGSEPERGRAFYPNDNAQELNSVDWKARYQELKNRKDWDPERDFIGLKRLGDRYHPIDPFFKFEGTPDHMLTFDNVWIPFIGLCFGTISSITANFWSRRPLVSALPIHVGVGLLGLGAGLYARANQRRRARERDAVLIHYLLLHEKDFPIIGQ